MFSGTLEGLLSGEHPLSVEVMNSVSLEEKSCCYAVRRWMWRKEVEEKIGKNKDILEEKEWLFFKWVSITFFVWRGGGGGGGVRGLRRLIHVDDCFMQHFKSWLNSCWWYMLCSIKWELNLDTSWCGDSLFGDLVMCDVIVGKLFLSSKNRSKIPFSQMSTGNRQF